MAKQYLDLTGLTRYDSKIKEYISEHSSEGAISNIALDNSSSTVVISGGTATIGMASYALKTDISAVLKFKGTKTSDELAALTGMVTGDVYQIVSGGTSTTYKVGSEYAYTGSAWTELGPAIDLSGYVTTSTTVNSKALSGNITLDGSDIALTGYTKASAVSAIAATDTVNQAIGKLEKAIDGIPSASIRLAGTFTSLQAYTDKVAEYTAMSAAEKAAHLGETWLIPASAQVTGFNCDTYASFIDAAHPEMKSIAAYKSGVLSWTHANDIGTTLPSVSEYSGDLYDGRLYQKTDEDAFYVYKSAPAGTAGTWVKFTEATSAISNSDIDSLFSSNQAGE